MTHTQAMFQARFWKVACARVHCKMLALFGDLCSVFYYFLCQATNLSIFLPVMCMLWSPFLFFF